MNHKSVKFCIQLSKKGDNGKEQIDKIINENMDLLAK